MSTVPLTLSASRARAFATCPHRFARDYVDRLPDGERAATPELAFGASIPMALAEFFRQGGRSQVSLSERVGMLRASWDSRHYANAEEEQAQVRRGIEMMRRFHGGGFPGDAAEFVAIERLLSWPRAHRGLIATGKLDLVCPYPPSLLDVVDFKTGAIVLTPEEAMWDFQAVLYRSLAASGFRELRPSTIRVSSRYLDPGANTSLEFQEEDFLIAWERVEAVARQISAAMAVFRSGASLEEALPRKNGRQCQTCPIRLACGSDGQVPIPGEESLHGPVLG
ncbi:MAG: PD-(D/E)XK nuclease family protein [Candidatus Sericytochromatia bacterium]|nr:PD-(D/E)XK nuclease family protein [Candidatus Tanganyikabacteria bacterium]